MTVCGIARGMQDLLKVETEKLARSWMQHEAGWLRDYLVAGVEDPRLNLQSVLTRHFITRAVSGDRFCHLMHEECRFAAVMNWLAKLARQAGQTDDLAVVLHSLRRASDNAEGLEIPPFILHTFRLLPTHIDGVNLPNYVESFLAGSVVQEGRAQLHEPSLDTFMNLWRTRWSAADTPLETDKGVGSRVREEAGSDESTRRARTVSVLEPACGSANEYRFLERCGLPPRMQYAGFDLCAKNVDNARALFPGVQFSVGNVFEIPAAAKSFDLCCVQDLFEHLSLEALPIAISEVCRVTREGLCLGFFNLDEIREHVARPMEDYHWNTLSLARLKEEFALHGFAAQAIQIGSFLQQEFGCHYTHNPNAYTLLLRARSNQGGFAKV
jgi:SAM-dependent methyltransferase